MRHLTVADEARGDKLRDLGCIVCLNVHYVFTEPAIHHIDGKTKPGCHDLTIPLCGKHHQIKCNEKISGRKVWISLHGDGRKAFAERYGTELELLDQVNEMIGL